MAPFRCPLPSVRAVFIAMVRQHPDGSRTPFTMPIHKNLRNSTLRTICNQTGIPRNDFLHAYEKTC
jgi:hypothetical protein